MEQPQTFQLHKNYHSSHLLNEQKNSVINRTAEQEGARPDVPKAYQAFLIVLGFRINTHNHTHFSFAIKIVLEEVSQFGISVWNHLQVKYMTGLVSCEYAELHPFKR